MDRTNIIIFVIYILYSFDQISTASVDCRSKQTCSSCAQEPDCRWCPEEVFRFPYRCEHRLSIPLDWCFYGNILDQRQLENSQCPCEIPGDSGYEENALMCAKNGDQKCGICFCSPKYFGKHCECDSEPGLSNQAEALNACRATNTSSICSNNGACVCGKCECNYGPNGEDLYYGQYCECSNHACPKYNGKICGGPVRGRCECGKCVCNHGWSGPDCSCTDSLSECISPKNGNVCSKKGTCVCGKCVCQKGKKFTFYGKYCESKEAVIPKHPNAVLY